MNLSTISDEQSLTTENDTGSSKTDIVQKIKANLFRQERDRLKKVIARFRQASYSEDFLLKVTEIVRQNLQVDRALIYRFESTEKGQIVAESLVFGWTPSQDEILPSICFGSPKASDYIAREYVAIANVEHSRVTPYQKQLLEKLQVKASLAIPILLDSYSVETNSYNLNKAWGLLVVQQCEKPRQWEEEEINLLSQLSTELTLCLQRKEPNLQLAQNKDVFSLINKEMQQLMDKLLQQLRQSLQTDRVLVYGFNPNWSGEVLAESFDSKWSKAGNSFDFDYQLKGDDYKPYYVVNDIYAKGYARCFIESLEKIQAKAYIIVPIKYNNQLLGVVGAYQNSDARNWQQSEVNVMLKYADKLSFPLQQTTFLRNSQFQTKQMEKAIERERSLSKMLERMQIAKNESSVFQIATQEGRKVLEADRLAIYRFNEDWGGEFIAESVGSGWSKLTENIPLVKDTFLQENEGGRYKFGECLAVDDIYMAGHQACHIELLEQFEARAYAIAPIFIGDKFGDKKLWGLVGVYQNTGSRKWQDAEIETLRQIGLQVGIALEQIISLKEIEKQLTEQKQIAEQEKAIARTVDRIRTSQRLEDIFRYATQEVRSSLEADRVVVYRFNEDWSGRILAESMSPGWVSAIEIQEQDDTLYNTEMSANSSCTLTSLQTGGNLDEDTYLKRSEGGEYTRGKKFNVVNDIYKADFSPCYLQSLEKYQAKAYVIVPIFKDDRLWGLFAAYQNSRPRNWQSNEVNLMLRLSSPLGIAIQQAEKATKLEQTLQRERGLSRLLERVQEVKTVDKLFQIATKEARQLINVDRVAIFRFNKDWSGEFVGESFSGNWVNLMQTIPYVRDTFLQETEGGRYRENESLAVNDIYKAGHDPCHVEFLEQLQAKAYMISPIFVDSQLWGLIGAYQNTGARNWNEDELATLKQVGLQTGVALQKINYLEQVQLQADNLAKTLAREKAAKEELQKQALDILKTVRPAFSGDLTVRANVTETEIGTVAGAYNTTLDSLKDIVVQVKDAVEKVAATTGDSNLAMEGLSFKAQKQLQELELALEQIQATIETSTVTTQNAQKVETAIQQADSVVQNGDRAMNKTVESILGIRETVADAGKRVKRLSDSSQKISRVVNLISSFAAQTNLLALNAALEATRAGEYGKGFAVVADEVRNLSLQSSEATSEIEKLVRDIQDETQEVASAMETGVQQVAEGTNLVNETRNSLNEIVTSTKEIRELVKDISQAADAQTKQAQSVTQVVGQVATIANETSEDSRRISGSFQELETLAQNLKSNVSRFKVK